MARFVEVAANRGVDSSKPGAEWMMVPLGASNLVCLSDGVGYSVAEAKGGKRLTIAEIPAKGIWGAIGSFLTPDTRVFRVTGHAGGETAIEAKKGKDTATVKVSVHPKRSFKVAFFFLQDKDAAGKVASRTAFAPSDADGWIEGLNGVFAPQANIWFEKAKSEFFPVTDLGVAVGGANDLATLAAKHKSSGAPISIFLAGSKIETLDGDYPLGFFHIASKVIVVKDQFVADPWAGLSAPMLKTIAHEIGHFMNYTRGRGEGHDYYSRSGYRSDILNTLDGGDIKISRQRVLDWNPW